MLPIFYNKFSVATVMETNGKDKTVENTFFEVICECVCVFACENVSYFILFLLFWTLQLCLHCQCASISMLLENGKYIYTYMFSIPFIHCVST